MGAEPRISQEIISGQDDENVLQIVDKIVQCYQENAKKSERLGKLIERVGLDLFRETVTQ